MNRDELIICATQAREHAYAAYSNFKVGAALPGKSGRICTGCTEKLEATWDVIS